MCLKKLCRKIDLLILFLLLIFSEGQAQFTYFGKNKVHYEKFNWFVLKTEHFDIYYYPEITEIAEIGALIAEEGYNELKVKFNHQILYRIPLIFYNTHIHFQQTNTIPGLLPEGVGGFFEFIKGRVVIPFEGSIEKFRHVIKHELVHVFMLNKIRRIQQDFRLTSETLPPLWFVEGLAEYWSTDWDSQAEMILRDAVLNGYAVGLNEIDKVSGTYLMYKLGQLLMHYISKTYGEHKILMLMENSWKSSNFEDVWKYTFGVDYKEFDRDWLYYLKKRYYPIISDRDLPGYSVNKLTNSGFNFSPVFYEKKNESSIYYLGNIRGYTSIYRIPFVKEGERKFSEPQLVLQGESSDEFESLHLFRTSFGISRDGRIVFTSKSKGRDKIYIFDINQNKITLKLSFDEITSISNPSFSHDGKKITFSAIDNKGYSDIYVYEFNRSKLIRLTNDLYDDKTPAFSPDDNIIVFTSDRMIFNGKTFYNLFSIKVDNFELTPITALNQNFSYPKFTSSKILFTCDYDNVNNIWSVDFNTDGNGNFIFDDKMKKVTNFSTSTFDPFIINDTTLIFSAFEKFSFQIFSINNFISMMDSINYYVLTKIGGMKLHWFVSKIDGIRIKERYKYEREYTLDFAQSQISTNPVYGTTGGAIFAVSDLLSDEYYQFLVFNTAQSRDEILKSFNVLISRISLAQKTNFAYGVYHFSGRRYDIRDSDEYFYERSFGVYFALSYPFSFFRRLEASVMLGNSNKEVFYSFKNRKALLLTNTISYIFDNSLWASTGPIDGSRLLILLGQTNDIKFSNVNYYSFMLDYRNYLRLGMKSAFASRFQLFINEGKEARRFFMGGNWDLRGYPRWSIKGEKLWLSSFEFRFPLIDQISLKFPFLTVNLYEFRGATFFDIGNAWDVKYKETLGSIGFGLRMNLFGVLVLRYDIGKRIEDSFRRLQDRMFYQFFFGWDF